MNAIPFRASIIFSLLIVASLARAQSQLAFRCHVQGGGFSSLITISCVDPLTGANMGSWTGGAWVPLSIRLRAIPTDSANIFIVGDSLSFLLDTTSDKIRDLVYYSTTSTPNNPAEVTVNYSLRIDSIKFVWSGDSVVCEKNYPMFSIIYDTTYAQFNANHSNCSGTQISDSVMPVDTFDLVLTGIRSGVVQRVAVSQGLTLTNDLQNNSIRAIFAPCRISASLKIFDEIGRAALSIPIVVGDASTEFSTNLLHPGCYFARLGDAVAKFIVPPR